MDFKVMEKETKKILVVGGGFGGISAALALEEEKKGWTEEKIKETIDTGRRKIVQLTAPLSVHLTYQTTWVDKEGSIHFNRDVYGRGTELSLALLGENQPMRN